uniref:Cytochrome c oxidase subunit 3 n=1 Tax=Pharyngomonas kirbyi TaxID=63601 RepID=A0A1W6R260_9EUKA|nr:cytochrome c oxidase subunit 3 [Pharyngomonas kirbyi]ARO47976.1 cytochrome c oxidase subunit 3 [Pharyngomonas kirbyi]
MNKTYGVAYPKHPWNIVDKSPWPFVSGLSSFFFVLGFVSLLHGYGVLQLDVGLASVLMSFTMWNRDIVREGTFQGKHTSFVKTCLKTGFKYFIVSEFMLFFSFFWAFYHFYLNGSVETAYVYPPMGLGMDDKLPGIMNLILIMSGSIITFSHIHHNLKVNKEHIFPRQLYLLLTIMFGMIFISCQVYEYCHNSFTFSDSTFGSVFYLLTGCHSLHVIVGVSFLIVSWARNLNNHTTFHHNLNYILAIWYWHFVDVIWIFLYLKVYYLFHFIASDQSLKFHYTMYDFSGGSMHFNYFELLLQKSLEKLGKVDSVQ